MQLQCPNFSNGDTTATLMLLAPASTLVLNALIKKASLVTDTTLNLKWVKLIPTNVQGDQFHCVLTCACNTRYDGDGIGCADINECLDDPCHADSM